MTDSTSVVHKHGHAVGFDPLTAAALPVYLLLLKSTSTYAQDANDEHLSDLDLDFNEVTAAGYERQQVEGLAATWDPDDKVWRLTADDVTTDSISSSGGAGYVGVVYYLNIDDDDDLSLVLRSDLLDVIVPFTGAPVVISTPDGILERGAAA